MLKGRRGGPGPETGPYLISGQILAPTSKMRDLSGVGNRVRLTNESLHGFAILQHRVADAQRRGHALHETAETVLRHGPDLDFDSGALETVLPDQSRLGNGALDGVETVAWRGTAGFEQPRAPLSELPVQGLPA